ncbi:SGNH hydrolase-type esterase domain-containing protein [Amylocarpus encephaloides]|uniref:SGNH hydrolase-type esterase domain-containing protein n=1 Tax=Amylocarpus encephaloides TaxID=45428 RepID=A0A9P7YDJ9_9HELO|nr:SGNH hydrolase-type esterase domain-containing protein [Amylocarpus encephaloides]
MYFSSLLSLIYLATTQASPIASKQYERAAKPAAFFLAGDSTTAIKGGWGNGFLTLLTNGAIGTNFGHSGATTKSFVAGGDWAKVISAVKANSEKYTTYVTIQFGHNDQKEAANISLPQFTTNLKRMTLDVLSAGGHPILTTSLTRRTFSGGKVIENLSEQVAATLQVAKDQKVQSIDLNKASTAYINAVGQANADKYNLESGDRTHVNPEGELLFGNMVAWLIESSTDEGLGAQTESFLAPKTEVVEAIEAGKFILP